MNVIGIGKIKKDGIISNVVKVYNDDLSRYSGEDLMMQHNKVYWFRNWFKYATIKQNVAYIHKMSNGSRDMECFMHLCRMINEYGLLWHKIFEETKRKNIIVKGQEHLISGFNINAKSLSNDYCTILFLNDDASMTKY